jgi:hypothetical protein
MRDIADISGPRPNSADSEEAPFVTGMPSNILRLEGRYRLLTCDQHVPFVLLVVLIGRSQPSAMSLA